MVEARRIAAFGGVIGCWRWRLGCGVLVAAIAFAAGWVRSTLVFDLFHLNASRIDSLGIESKRQTLCFSWVRDSSASTAHFPFWMTMESRIKGTELPSMYNIGPFACYVNAEQEPYGIIVTSPYWCVTIGLTICAACLLLWNPKVNSQAKRRYFQG
jgi:hypothetical protein